MSHFRSKQVNLFQPVMHKFDRAKILQMRTKRLSLLASILFFFFTIGLIFFQRDVLDKTAAHTETQRVLRQKIGSQLSQQVDLSVIAARLDLIEKAQSKEAKFLRSYQGFLHLVDETHVSVFIKSFTLHDAAGSYNAKLVFSSDADLLDFVKQVESDAFKKKTKLLALPAFKIGEKGEENLTIDVNGVFSPSL